MNICLQNANIAGASKRRTLAGRYNTIINIQFSITKDLNAINPAKILRENFDLKYTPLFCTQEADILNALNKAIRILISTKSDCNKEKIKHIHLKKAKTLRPDL